MTDLLELKPSGDRKTRFYGAQKNTFGLLPGLEGTCPGATTSEGGCWHIKEGRKLPECYVAGTMASYPGVKGVLEHNTMLLMNGNHQEMVDLLSKEFRRFDLAEARRETSGAKVYRYYRIHWSGDIFSEPYAVALSCAMGSFPNINFWCYTRSFFAIPHLVHLNNLTLYLSLDPVNVQRGLSVFNEYKTSTNNLQICYMSKQDDFQTHLTRAQQILDEENNLRKQMKLSEKENWALQQLRVCPVDSGKLKLEGGCANCRACLKHKPTPVWFQS